MNNRPKTITEGATPRPPPSPPHPSPTPLWPAGRQAVVFARYPVSDTGHVCVLQEVGSDVRCWMVAAPPGYEKTTP